MAVVPSFNTWGTLFQLYSSQERTTNTRVTSSEFVQATEHHRAGRTDRAESSYRKILEREPRHDQALYLLGLIELEASHLQEALTLFQRAIEAAPHMPGYHANLGVTLHRMKKPREAVNAFHAALFLKPDFAEALFNASLALEDLGELELAFHAAERAADFKPDSYDIQYRLGCLLSRRRSFERAIGHFHCALCLNPKSRDCLIELGAALRTSSRPHAAISLAQRALNHYPDSPIFLNELGLALYKNDQIDAASAAFSKAIQLQPTLAEPHAMLGVMYTEVGRVREGVASLRCALQLRHDWSYMRSNMVFVMPFAPEFTDEDVCNEAKVWSRIHAVSTTVPARRYPNDRNPDRRLRVGYVSPNFSHHGQSFFTVPLFAHHDRSQVEVFCYASNDVNDHVTQQHRARADTWRDVICLNHAQLAEAVQSDRIDILVDLTMHMDNGRPLLFAHKPAPVQICWLAYPGTTGLREMDYRITDPYLDPPERCHLAPYSERSIILPNSFWCYDPLETELAPSALPAAQNGYVTFGSFNHYCKIHDGVVKLWARVLSQVKGSRMIITAPAGQARERTLNILVRAGIEETRITFHPRLPRQDYLRLYQQTDLCLDSYPYGGHTTSLDSYWMGVPVVALLGSTVVGRAALTLASNLDLHELLAHSPDEYVRIACDLSGNQTRLQQLRSSLRSRMLSSALMDHARFARNMECAYRAAWRNWCLGDGDRSPIIIEEH